MSTRSATAEDGSAHEIVRVLEPQAGWVPIGWAELWEYRELLGFLVWRDVKVRYKQTVLGAAWAILQPLSTMVMFTVLFGRLAKMPSDGLPYAPFAFAALIPWTFFSNAVSSSANSLIGNTHLISKVYFPRLLVTISCLGTGVVDALVALVVMFGMLLWYRVGLTSHIVFLPVFIALTAAASLAVGAALAALCAVYRDVRYVIPFMMQLGLFASPVIYPVHFVPARWQWIFYLNPIAGAIDGFRGSLLGLPFNVPAIATAWVVTIVSGWLGLAYFRRVERRVADLL